MTRHVIFRDPEAVPAGARFLPAPLGTIACQLMAEAWVEFHALVRDCRQLQQLYDRTTDANARREKKKLEDQLDVAVARLAEAMGENAPPCPKCGMPMQGGAPHGPWPVQWECHRCGTVVVPQRDQADQVGEGGAA